MRCTSLVKSDSGRNPKMTSEWGQTNEDRFAASMNPKAEIEMHAINRRRARLGVQLPFACPHSLVITIPDLAREILRSRKPLCIQSCPPRPRFVTVLRVQKRQMLFLSFVGVLILLFGLLLGALFQRARRTDDRPALRDTANLITKIQPLAQLVTMKYVIEKVVIFEDAKWFGDSRVILVAHGIVKAGVDLNQLKPGDIRVEGGKIQLQLPPAKITDLYLDDKRTEIIDRTTGVLRQFDKTLEQQARRAALDHLKLAARESGILREAEERARLQLTALFLQLGYESPEFQKAPILP